MVADSRKNVDIVVRARTEGLGNVGRAAANFYVLQEVFGQLASGVSQLSPALGRLFQDVGRNVALIKGLAEFGPRGAFAGFVVGGVTTVMSALAESHARAKAEADAHAKAIDQLERSYGDATRAMRAMRGEMFAGNEAEIEALERKLKELSEQRFDPGDLFAQARRGLAGESRLQEQEKFQQRQAEEIQAARNALEAQKQLRINRLAEMDAARDERVARLAAEEKILRLRTLGQGDEARRLEIAERYRQAMVEAAKQTLSIAERQAMIAKAAAERNLAIAQLAGGGADGRRPTTPAAVQSRFLGVGGQYLDPAQKTVDVLRDIKAQQSTKGQADAMLELLKKIAENPGVPLADLN